MAVWVVRGGREGEQQREQEALEKGLLAIRFAGMQEKDLTGVRDKEEIKRLYQRLNPGEMPRRVSTRVGEIWRYKAEMQIGDLVVMPFKGQGVVAIGEVSGEYEYRAESPLGHVHCRRVTWINKYVPNEAFGDDELGLDLQGSMNSQLTVYRPLSKRNGKPDRNAQAERRLRVVAEGNLP